MKKMKKMKMCMAMLLVLMLLPFEGTAQSLLDETTITKSIYAQTGTRFFMAPPCFYGDTAYLCMEDGIVYSHKIGDEAPQKFAAVPPIPDALRNGMNYLDMNGKQDQEVADTLTNIVANEKALYALNIYSGGIGVIDSRGITWTDAKFDSAMFMDKDGWQRGIYTIWADASTIYCMVDYYEEEMALPYNCSLVTLDILTGDTRRVKTPGALSMCLKDADSLLYIRQDEFGARHLSLCAIDSGESVDVPIALPDEPCGALAYDASLDAIYVTTGGGIYRSLQGAAFEMMRPHDSPMFYELINGFVTSQGMYTVRLDGFVLFDVSAPVDKSNLLTLRINQGGMQENTLFKAQYPDVMLNVQYLSERVTAKDVAERIRAGDKETDIFELTVDGTFAALVERGYAQPLVGSPALDDAFETLYPALKNTLKDAQGLPVAYPRQLNIAMGTVNEQLWQKHFGDAPLPTTFADFFRAMVDFEQRDGRDSGDLFLDYWSNEYAIRHVIDNYILQRDRPNAPIVFNTPELSEVLSVLEQLNALMAQKDVAALNEGEMYPYADVLDRSIFYLFGGGGGILNSVERKSTLLFPLAFSDADEGVIQGLLNVLVINPLSEHKQQALQYIACVAQPEANLELYYKIHENATQPVEKPDYQTRLAGYLSDKQELEEQLQKLDEDAATTPEKRQRLVDSLQSVQWYLDNEEFLRWQISPYGIATWREIAPRIRYYENSLFINASGEGALAQVDELIVQYAAGRMTTEGFLEKLDATMNMVYLEQQ